MIHAIVALVLIALFFSALVLVLALISRRPPEDEDEGRVSPGWQRDERRGRWGR